MWIVRLALRRPYTIVVLAILILITGALTIFRTPTDIFPNIDIPVVSIIWNYNGLVPKDISDRIVSVTERALTTTVDNIEHIESQSLYGVAVVKVFLQPTAKYPARDSTDHGGLPDSAQAVTSRNHAASLFSVAASTNLSLVSILRARSPCWPTRSAAALAWLTPLEI